MSLLGLDVGITGCKAKVITVDGQILGSAYKEYSLISPRPGWLECDPGMLWQSVCEVVGRAAATAHSDPVEALSISASGDDIIPIDREGRPLSNSPSSMDVRGADQKEWWDEIIGEERIYAITGVPFHPMHSVNKILWFRRHMPEIFARADKFLCWEDYLLLKFASQSVIDFSAASRTMAFDIHRKEWSDEILSRAGIDVSLFAKARPSGDPLGRINHDLAYELELSPNVIVVTGGLDQACAALGAGSISPGIAVVGTGTVECLTVASEKPLLTKEMLAQGYSFNYHVANDLFLGLADNFGGGSLLRWYRDNFAAEEKQLAQKTGQDIYDIIVHQARKEPSDLFVLPHFSGAQTPWEDPYSRGAIIGLTLTTTKPDLVRGILDGITYELRLNIDRLEQTGLRIEELRATGGGARSRQWLQIKANVTGKKVISLQESEAGCLAAAILAGIGIGTYKSFEEATAQLVKTKEEFFPDPEEYELYQEKYKVYAKLYPTISPIIHEISQPNSCRTKTKQTSAK